MLSDAKFLAPYVMTKIEDENFMTFGGSDAPCAIVGIAQFGFEDKEFYGKLTAAVCENRAPHWSGKYLVGENMRLFIAIQFNKEMKDALLKTMHEMKKSGIGGNYVPGGNLHLTLAFIGESSRAAEIIEAIDAVKFKPFKIKLDKPGNFGDLLWAGISGGQGLAKVSTELRKNLDAAGIDYDKKPFKPHITLVRKSTNAKLQGIKFPPVQMEVKEISLMKSENKGGKLVYTRI